MQLQAFEWYSEGDGKHWGTLSDLIPKLCDFGITALWIPRKLEENPNRRLKLTTFNFPFKPLQKPLPKVPLDMMFTTSSIWANLTRKEDKEQNGAPRNSLSTPSTRHGNMGSSHTWMPS